jgi:predicted transcriptional regulator
MREFYNRLCVLIDPEQVAWIDEYAARTKQTRSIVTRQAIAQMQHKDRLKHRAPVVVIEDLVE